MKSNYKKMKRSNIITGIAIIYLVAIFTLFVMSAQGLGDIYDKAGIKNDAFLHILAFFILAFLLRLMFTARKVRRPLLLSTIISISAAGIIELIQHMLPWRHATFHDVALHLTGIAAYVVIDLFIPWKKDKAD